MVVLLEVLAVIGALIGAALLFLTVTASNGAPQEAAGAAIAIAFAVIPYCLASLASRRQIANALAKSKPIEEHKGPY